jgi:hypothetical protein
MVADQKELLLNTWINHDHKFRHGISDATSIMGGQKSDTCRWTMSCGYCMGAFKFH